MLEMKPCTPISVSVSVTPSWWPGIGAVRRFIRSYLRPVLPDDLASERVALTAHELLENAVKYAAEADAPIICSALVTADEVVVRVTNRAAHEHVRTLREEIAVVMEGDALETYLAMMTRCLDDAATSQLGLARIRYEAAASLTMREEAADVSVEARVALHAA